MLGLIRQLEFELSLPCDGVVLGVPSNNIAQAVVFAHDPLVASPMCLLSLDQNVFTLMNCDYLTVFVVSLEVAEVEQVSKSVVTVVWACLSVWAPEHNICAIIVNTSKIAVFGENASIIVGICDVPSATLFPHVTTEDVRVDVAPSIVTSLQA